MTQVRDRKTIATCRDAYFSDKCSGVCHVCGKECVINEAYHSGRCRCSAHINVK